MRYTSLVLLIVFLASPLSHAENQIDFERDVLYYKKIVYQEGINAQRINALGFAYYKIHRIPDALNAFIKASALDPSYTPSINNAGIIYLHIKDYIKAEDAFRAALRLDPHYVKAAFNLSATLFRQKKYYDALKFLQLAKNIDESYVINRLSDLRVKRKIEQQLNMDLSNINLYEKLMVLNEDKTGNERQKH